MTPFPTTRRLARRLKQAQNLADLHMLIPDINRALSRTRKNSQANRDLRALKCEALHQIRVRLAACREPAA